MKYIIFIIAAFFICSCEYGSRLPTKEAPNNTIGSNSFGSIEKIQIDSTEYIIVYYSGHGVAITKHKDLRK